MPGNEPINLDWGSLNDRDRCALVEWKIFGHELDELTGDVKMGDKWVAPRNFLENALAAQPVADKLMEEGWTVENVPCPKKRSSLSVVTISKDGETHTLGAMPAHKAIVRLALIAAGVVNA